MRGLARLIFLGCLAVRAGAIPAPECGGQAVFQLEGDGVKSDRVRLWCKNMGKAPLTVDVPKGTVFAHPGLQDLMVLESRKLVVPANGRVQCSLSTMCVGQRSEKPPTAQATEFTPVTCQSHPQAAVASHLYECAQKLCQNGDFPPLPMVRGMQPSVVAQYAFWREQGMTREDLKTLVFANTKPKAEAEAEANKGVDNIWEAVDLTQKEAETP